MAAAVVQAAFSSRRGSSPVMRLSASLFLAVTMSVVVAGFVLAELDNDWTIKEAPKRGFL